MEKGRHCGSGSGTGGSATSCSRTEKRPLNNNILINAPLPPVYGHWLKQMKRLLSVEKGSYRSGPPLSFGQATFHRLLPLLCGEGDSGNPETLRLLRPG